MSGAHEHPVDQAIGRGELWIVIPRWEDFQHPDAARSAVPPWIKDHTPQLAKDEYLALTFHQRGVLHGMRLEYARAKRQLRDSTSALSRRLGHRVMTRDLIALNHAGLIAFSASNPASKDASTLASTEQRREEISKERLGKGSSATDLPLKIGGDVERSHLLSQLLAEVRAPDAEKARLRAFIEQQHLTPAVLATARDELKEAKRKQKKIGNECGYVRRIVERQVAA